MEIRDKQPSEALRKVHVKSKKKKNNKEQKSIKTESKLTIEKNQQTLNYLFEN